MGFYKASRMQHVAAAYRREIIPVFFSYTFRDN